MRNVSSYKGFSTEELIEELGSVTGELSGHYVELSAIRVQYMWLFLQAYAASHETSVSGRERDGERAAVAVKEDEWTLLGQIESLTVVRDYLVRMVEWSRG